MLSYLVHSLMKDMVFSQLDAALRVAVTESILEQGFLQRKDFPTPCLLFQHFCNLGGNLDWISTLGPAVFNLRRRQKSHFCLKTLFLSYYFL